jgi:hypothetical protein
MLQPHLLFAVAGGLCPVFSGSLSLLHPPARVCHQPSPPTVPPPPPPTRASSASASGGPASPALPPAAHPALLPVRDGDGLRPLLLPLPPSFAGSGSGRPPAPSPLRRPREARQGAQSPDPALAGEAATSSLPPAFFLYPLPPSARRSSGSAVMATVVLQPGVGHHGAQILPAVTSLFPPPARIRRVRRVDFRGRRRAAPPAPSPAVQSTCPCGGGAGRRRPEAEAGRRSCSLTDEDGCSRGILGAAGANGLPECSKGCTRLLERSSAHGTVPVSLFASYRAFADADRLCCWRWSDALMGLSPPNDCTRAVARQRSKSRSNHSERLMIAEC